MPREDQSMIPAFLYMIRKIRRILFSTGFRRSTRTADRKHVSGKEKEQSIFGKRSLFRPMTGMNTPWRKYGGLPGQNTATDILQKRIALIIEAINDRVLRKSRQFMKELLPGKWKRRGDPQTDAGLTGRLMNAILSADR